MPVCAVDVVFTDILDPNILAKTNPIPTYEKKK